MGATPCPGWLRLVFGRAFAGGWQCWRGRCACRCRRRRCRRRRRRRCHASRARLSRSPAHSHPPLQGSTARRDLLLSLQTAAQSKWEAAKAFDIDAPAQGSGSPAEKFFGTFPYPYMNGVLHLGHAFSLSKLEFASAYHRLCGKNVLFAQGFHCTGMPIKVHNREEGGKEGSLWAGVLLETARCALQQ